MKCFTTALLLILVTSNIQASDYTAQPECSDGWTNAASDYVMPLDGAKAYAAGDADYMISDVWAFPQEFPDTPPGFRELMLTVKKQVASIHQRALPFASSGLQKGQFVHLPDFIRDMLEKTRASREQAGCPSGQGV